MPKKKDDDFDWLIKSYNNFEFINSPVARPIRILSEMIEPSQRLRKNKIHNTVVFFGSARTLAPAQAKKNLHDINSNL